MRLANVNGRAVIVTADDLRGIDVAAASDHAYGPDLSQIYDEWPAFLAWAERLQPEETVSFTRAELGCPSPQPRQVVAIGLNYAEHAAESGFQVPDTLPPTFTKFVSALSGPDSVVALPAKGNTDWEVELVVVIGRTARRVSEEQSWDHVAGLTVGQDLSERITQTAGPAPQFSLGKSFPGFAPVGPWLVTPDELPDPNALTLGCSVNGEVVQDGRTDDLIFSVAELVARLSHIITLHPGDLIFTGTPSGVGMGRTPPRFLQPGDDLVSWIEGIGRLQQRFVAVSEG